MSTTELEVRPAVDAGALAEAVADAVADALGRALVERGSAVLALSGGSTAPALHRRLAVREVDWRRVHVVQVDERVADDGDADRNWSAVDALLVRPTGAAGHPMPVVGPDGRARDDAGLQAGAAAYAGLLDELCGGVVDVVHLGLGEDGHTASLVPGDPVVDVVDADVAVTGPYRGRRRMTLTLPAIDRARTVLWHVAGAAKQDVLRRLLDGDAGIPAGRVRRTGDVRVHADEAALGGGGSGG